MKTGALAADGGSEGAVALTARMEIKIDIKSSSIDGYCLSCLPDESFQNVGASKSVARRS